MGCISGTADVLFETLVMNRYMQLIEAIMCHIGSGSLIELEVVHLKVSMLKTSTLSRRVS